ncbi:putative phytanoyl-CoA dioxygenase [Wickerhamomyces ciferrii]|uniref:Phytanoyl-CoA dioxygenase n=1 Tax=Wickerhamomyces ciferrii (strain ATCC 14091 / BCRC 22168 / CBS 111 / JCM 3599 / NBRC 0793 / NRRL Y-1031 F-60-10) TaxID=1206466 RepID=K0KXG1_WICCF|nr:putative phytanoyl-CoA dioxygenase [Wickerhamomyces ciferrii]CCH46727.1 putative phytanoyl-CoA dioxygenase [Wickerhamomyces ciferrii]
MTVIDTNEYLGNSTTRTLHRIELSELSKPIEDELVSNTPSLAETKKASIIEPPVRQTETPKITLKDISVNYNDATVDNTSEILEKYGVVIVKDFMNNVQLDKIKSELDPIFDSKKNDPRLYPKETIRVTASVSKSPAVVHEVLKNPLHVQLSEKFLAKKNAFWIGNNLNIGSSPAIVSSSIAFRVGPGASYQALHRDDHSEHNIIEHQDLYRYGSDTQLGVSVALSQVTKQNGGTRFIPGSHLWDHLRKPKEEECMTIEVDEGDGFFMLGSVFHGAGKNITNDEFRTLLILFMCAATSRQKENIYLTTPIDYFKQFDTEELKLLGLSMSEPFSGMLELQDARAKLKPGFVRKSNYSDVCQVSDVN